MKSKSWFSFEIFQNHIFTLQLLEFYNFNWEWPVWIGYPMKIVNERGAADTTTLNLIKFHVLQFMESNNPFYPQKRTERDEKRNRNVFDSINEKSLSRCSCQRGLLLNCFRLCSTIFFSDCKRKQFQNVLKRKMLHSKSVRCSHIVHNICLQWELKYTKCFYCDRKQQKKKSIR